MAGEMSQGLSIIAAFAEDLGWEAKNHFVTPIPGDPIVLWSLSGYQDTHTPLKLHTGKALICIEKQTPTRDQWQQLPDLSELSLGAFCVRKLDIEMINDLRQLIKGLKGKRSRNDLACPGLPLSTPHLLHRYPGSTRLLLLCGRPSFQSDVWPAATPGESQAGMPSQSHPPRLLFHSTLDGPGEDWKERFSALAFRFGKFVPQPMWPHTSQPKLGWQLGSTSPRRGEFHTSSWSPRVALGAVIIFTFV